LTLKISLALNLGAGRNPGGWNFAAYRKLIRQDSALRHGILPRQICE